jgi:hypothetical protein
MIVLEVLGVIALIIVLGLIGGYCIAELLRGIGR